VPLILAKPDAIPVDHSQCGLATHPGCLDCQAQEGLLFDDWLVIDFYRFVSEQVDNLTPFGTKDGSPNFIVPRYEGWLAGLLILGIPQPDWRSLVEDAEFVHGLIRTRAGKAKYYQLERDELYAPDEDPDG